MLYDSQADYSVWWGLWQARYLINLRNGGQPKAKYLRFYLFFELIRLRFLCVNSQSNINIRVHHLKMILVLISNQWNEMNLEIVTHINTAHTNAHATRQTYVCAFEISYNFSLHCWRRYRTQYMWIFQIHASVTPCNWADQMCLVIYTQNIGKNDDPFNLHALAARLTSAISDDLVDHWFFNIKTTEITRKIYETSTPIHFCFFFLFSLASVRTHQSTRRQT